MRTFRKLIPLLAVFLCTCRQQDVPSTELVEHTLQAFVPGGDEPPTSTSLDPLNDRKILWSPRESISIIVPDGPYDFQNYEFRGNNETAVAEASFSGLGPSSLGNYIALYPYNPAADFYLYEVSTTLPNTQEGKAGTFGDGYLVTTGQSDGPTVRFQHLCSGLRFRVGSDLITAVSLRGYDGETIAGDFSFWFSSFGELFTSKGTEEEVTLTAPDGGFEPGQDYYLVLLPTTFSKGFSLSLMQKETDAILTFDHPSHVEFNPGAFKNISGKLDERAQASERMGVYYGPENTFLLGNHETYSFDVSPRIISTDWQRTGLPAQAPHATSAEILWGNSVVSATLSGGKLILETGGDNGSSLVAIKNNGTILWSYLVWAEDDWMMLVSTLPGAVDALPPLGGGGLYFQWGRKDPLRADAGRIANQGTDGLAYSIAHPDVFIQGGAAYDWFCDTSPQDEYLWGTSGKKSVWDPCPAGYRIPSESDFMHLDFDSLLDFPELGYLADDIFYPTSRTYWTLTSSTSFSTALDDGNPPEIFFSQSRNTACPIRCVKE